MNPLENLYSLMNDMREKGWTITSFLFCYKDIEYTVLVKRFIGDIVRVNEYALVQLEFIKDEDFQNTLIVEANRQRLIIGAKVLRIFFDIKYSDNLGDIIYQFSEQLGKSIPVYVDNKDIEDIQKKAMLYSLSNSDSESPNKIHCIGVRHNPNGMFRSEFNADKTKLLEPLLFDKLKDDKRISFCYSDDINKKKSEIEILCDFSNER